MSLPQGPAAIFSLLLNTVCRGVCGLHSQVVTLRGGGKEQTIYYFAREPRPNESVADMPNGYTVVENPRNGFLTLKSK